MRAQLAGAGKAQKLRLSDLVYFFRLIKEEKQNTEMRAEELENRVNIIDLKDEQVRPMSPQNGGGGGTALSPKHFKTTGLFSGQEAFEFNVSFAHQQSLSKRPSALYLTKLLSHSRAAPAEVKKTETEDATPSIFSKRTVHFTEAATCFTKIWPLIRKTVQQAAKTAQTTHSTTWSTRTSR